MAGPKITVHIWSNYSGFNKFAGVGHAGLSFTHDNKEYYVTWFGTSASKVFKSDAHMALGFNKILRGDQIYNRISNIDKYNFKDGTSYYVNNKGEKAVSKKDKSELISCKPTLFEEKITYRELRYEFIALEVMNVDYENKTFHLGLDVAAMAAWWDAKMNLPPNHEGRKYKLISKERNCVSTVIEALIVGGMGSYVKLGSKHIYYSVENLRMWATNTREELSSRNKKLESRKVEEVIQEKSSKTLMDWKDIPSLKDWKKESDRNVALAFFKKRRGPIKVLDQLIPKYDDEKKKGDNLAIKGLLLAMLYQCIIHLITKRKSNRRNAVKSLAKIIFEKFNMIEAGLLRDAMILAIKRNEQIYEEARNNRSIKSLGQFEEGEEDDYGDED